MNELFKNLNPEYLTGDVSFTIHCEFYFLPVMMKTIMFNIMYTCLLDTIPDI